MEQTIKVEAQPGVSTIFIGEALEPLRPNQVSISGASIEGPRRYIEGKREEYVPQTAYLTVNLSKKEMNLVLNDHHEQPDTVNGVLKQGKLIAELGINAGNKLGAQALAKHLKFHKYLFADKTEANKIIAALMNFEATVTSMVTDKNDQQGNTVKKLETAVSKQVPNNFILKLTNLFEGIPSEVSVPVEICAEATSTSVQFYLESVDLVMLIEQEAARIISDEAKWFEETFPCSIVYLN